MTSTVKTRQRKSARVIGGLDVDKTYFTVAELSKKLGAEEAELRSAIRFGALETSKFPVRGARRFRVEESVAKKFALKFYAKML